MAKGSLDRAVVVTGASTGIGRAAVAKAVREGAHVFASVRKQEDADSLKSEFGEAVTPLLLDVADEAAVRAGAAQVAQALGGRRLWGLVNNAGIAVPGPLLHLDTDELRRQFEINLFGVHNVTRAFSDVLGADPDRTGKPGRIVMISSVGGQNGSPFVGPYSASKFALEGYSQSLRRELMLYGIDVIVVGHTCTTPIAKPETRREHKTNWHLSVHRAISVMNLLGQEKVAMTRLGVMGYGEYRPIADNASDAGKAKNRRVEIYLVRSKTVQAVGQGVFEVNDMGLAFANPARP